MVTRHSSGPTYVPVGAEGYFHSWRNPFEIVRWDEVTINHRQQKNVGLVPFSRKESFGGIKDSSCQKMLQGLKQHSINPGQYNSSDITSKKGRNKKITSE